MTIILRIGLIATALILVSIAVHFSWTIWPPAHPELLWIVLALSGYGVLCLVGSLMPRPHPALSWLVLIGLIGALGSYAYSQKVNYAPLYWTHTDNEMITEYSVVALRHGENPYEWDFSDMTRAYRDRGNRTTLFLDNSTQYRHTYPIFPTLLLYGFTLIGIEQVRTVSLIFQIALLIMMFLGAPRPYRPVILLPLFVLKDFQVIAMLGAQDIVWSAFLVAFILVEPKPTLQAIFLGLAVNHRQQPWFVLPFILIHYWHTADPLRLDRIKRLIGISVGLFAIMNLPFFLWNPEAWILGTLEPAYAQFNVVSQGAAALTQYGVLPLTRGTYTVLGFSFYFLALLIHWRHPRQVGQAFWIFPAIFFWLFYRGLGNYWFYWIPPLIVGFTRGLAIPRPVPEIARWRTTARIALTVAVLNIGIVGLVRGTPVSIKAVPPFELTPSGNPEINQIMVEVTNHGDKRLYPRFSIQYDRPTEVYPWIIKNGPLYLEAGQTAHYLISAENNLSKTFWKGRGAQIVLSDADMNYRYRAVVSIPDQIIDNDLVNPAFLFWRDGRPYGWEINEEAALILENIDGHYALVADMGIISQTIPRPQHFAVWVYPPTQLILTDGRQSIKLIFSTPADLLSGAILIDAEPRQWTRHVIDLDAMAHTAGLPPWGESLTIRLVGSGIFGKFEEVIPLDDAYFAAHPDVYYVRVGRQYSQQGRLDEAEAAFHLALSYNPDNLAAQAALESLTTQDESGK